VMATDGEKYKGLRTFFEASFHPWEMQIFLSENGFEDIATTVSTNIGGTKYLFDVVEALAHRGLINSKFFDLLTQQRPAKEEQIKSLSRLWLDEDKTDSTPSGSGSSSGPRNVVPAESTTPWLESALTPKEALEPLSLVAELRKFLNELELALALLVYRFDLNSKQTAYSLRISEKEFKIIHQCLLNKLMNQYKGMSDILSLLKNRPL
jgi:hypothetical protein